MQIPSAAEELQILILGASAILIGLKTNDIEEVFSYFKNVTNRKIELVVGYKRPIYTIKNQRGMCTTAQG